MLQSYSNTLIELKVAQKRLQYLRNRKEELFTLYIMPKAMQVDQIGGQNMPHYTDNVMRYVTAVNSPGEKGISLNDEIIQEERHINHLTTLLEAMTEAVVKLDGIEMELFVQIMINGMKATKAVEKVAEARGYSTETIWHNYYPKVRAEIQRIRKAGNNDV